MYTSIKNRTAYAITTLCALTAMIVTGCSDTHSVTGPGTRAAAEAAVTVAPRIGYTATINGSQPDDQLEVTLLNKVDPDPAKVAKSTAGTHYVSFQIRIANSTRSTKAYNGFFPYGITAQDPQGQYLTQSAERDTQAGVHLPLTFDVAPGSQALGYVSFVVQDGDTVSRVQMKLGTNTAVWATSR